VCVCVCVCVCVRARVCVGVCAHIKMRRLLVQLRNTIMTKYSVLQCLAKIVLQRVAGQRVAVCCTVVCCSVWHYDYYYIQAIH